MKKILSFILVLIMVVIFSPFAAFADDYSAYSDDELSQMYNTIRNELFIRGLKAEDKTILVDEKGVQVYVDGDFIIEKNIVTGLMLKLPIIIVNNSSTDILLQLRDSSINGWSCDTATSTKVLIGKKAKAELCFKLENVDVSELSELEDVEFKMFFGENGNFAKAFFTTEPITIYYP